MTKTYGYLRLSAQGILHFNDYAAELQKNGATEIVTDRPTPYHRTNFYKLIASSSAGDTVVIKRQSHLSADPEIARQLEMDLALNQIRLKILDPHNMPPPAPGADHGGE
jgi:DNA invertase Pin-like site-specific DNA recombinase